MTTPDTPPQTGRHQPGPPSWKLTMDAVDQPYHGESGPRPEHNRFSWECSLLEFSVFLNDPHPLEVLGFRNAPVLMGFHPHGPVLWAALEIPGVHTADAPFTPHLVPPPARRFPALNTPATRYPVKMIMADARDGTVRSIRLATLSPAASRQLLQATIALLDQPFDEATYQNAIDTFYARNPRPDDVLRLCQPMEQLGP